MQPTPRWEMVASSVTLTLEKRAVMTNMVLKVKDVPLFYLPAMYYPINKEDRATGFLLPIYGNSSTIKGQTLNNAFFWAINRSQDATLYHSFYSKTGQSFGGEYRYVSRRGRPATSQTLDRARARSRLRAVRRHEADVPGHRQLQRHRHRAAAAAGEPAPDRVAPTTSRAWSRSSATSRTSSRRPTAPANFGGNIAGNWGANSISGTFDRNEMFTNDTDSNVDGSRPRVIYSRAEKPIGELPIYFGATSEYVDAGPDRTNAGGEINDARPDPHRRVPDAAVPVHEAAVPDLQLVAAAQRDLLDRRA